MYDDDKERLGIMDKMRSNSEDSEDEKYIENIIGLGFDPSYIEYKKNTPVLFLKKPNF
jgi:uncharacterized membrane protein YebE (DUF533 family)